MSRYALDICRHYRQAGWGVTAMTRDAKVIDDLFRREDIELLHAPLGGIWDIGSARVLARHLKKLRNVEVVMHAHGFRTAFTALLARKIAGRKDVRIVMTRHKVGKGIDSWLFRRIYRNLDAMVFVSRLAALRFMSTWHDRPYPFPADRIHILHDSLNIGALPRCAEPSGPVCAMFHGHLVPGKGIETLIDAMAMLKGERIRLRIVGTGAPDYVDRMRLRAQTRGVMERIDWHKPSGNTLDDVAGCTFGVLPSQAEEAFGLENLEYMACGKPQVCTSNGAQPEYLTDGREAFLVLPGNPSALAAAMRKLASDPGLRQRMGTRARETFDANLSWPKFINTLDSLYSS